MKSCDFFEILLTAYLRKTLKPSDLQALEKHLETCESCRAKLEAVRASLKPAPVAKSPAARRRPASYAQPKRAKEDFWFGLRLKPLLASGVIFAILFFLSGSLVIFSVVQKSEKKFCPPKPVERPGMKLRKLQMPVKMAPQEDKNKPQTRKQVGAENGIGSDVDIPIPEIVGVRGGSGFVGEMDSSSTIEFPMEEPAAEEAAEFEAVPAVSRPKMKLKKPMVQVKKNSKPKSSTRIVTKVQKSRMPEIYLPEMSGIGSGRDSGSGGVDGFDIFPDIKEITILGSAVNIEEAEPVPEPVPEPVAVSHDDLFGDYVQLDEDLELLKDEQAWGVPGKPMPAEFNPYVLAQENAFSTFSIDVDTASYGLARQQLLEGTMPVPEMVRTEEFINSFNYNYRPPTGRQTFAVHTEMAPSPFRTGMDLLKVGIKGRRIGRDDHRGAVLTLVIDTSGSMATPERLGLIKQSLALLLDELNPEDQVAIAQFGGEARLVLEHTPVSQKEILLDAINMLQPGGPTQFDKGLELGYQLAMNGFSAGDSNRIMIMSDGVATLGELDPEVILEQVSEQRKKGIYLSVLGFGAGTYDDDMLERLANSGDGMYAYIDTIEESRRLLVDQLAATLHVIASDVKIQVEFNPARVLRYRQLGYENRQLTKEQFRDDSVDAGEVGSGQSVTALYDIELIPGVPADEPIATVYVRYRRADNGAIEEISRRVTDRIRHKRFTDADPRFQLAACTAEFAERLRCSPYADGTELKEIAAKLQPVVMELELDEQVDELSHLLTMADLFERR
ncbi:von Willebrand factor type A domain-containing protein [Pontiellaceae bacterium B1224]|nr:von Willebrand factor type A domain-containing protein [Pontiellaceae bacterium B1224]